MALKTKQRNNTHVELPTVPFVAAGCSGVFLRTKAVEMCLRNKTTPVDLFQREHGLFWLEGGKHRVWARGVSFSKARKKCCFFISESMPGTCCFFVVFFLSCMGRVPACAFGACVVSAVGCDAKHLCVCVAFNLRRSCYACSSLFLSYLVHVPMLPAAHLAPACLVPSLVRWDVRAVSCSHLDFPGCVYRP